jgi:hypothetical protein
MPFTKRLTLIKKGKSPSFIGNERLFINVFCEILVEFVSYTNSNINCIQLITKSVTEKMFRSEIK